MHTVPQQDWDEGEQRARVIRNYLRQNKPRRGAAAEAANELGISKSLFYRLVARWQQKEQLVTDVVRHRSSGGRGQTRLSREQETIIAEAIRSLYLSRQRRRLSAVMRKIQNRCRAAKIASPARNTVQARIKALDQIVVKSKREGQDATRPLYASRESTLKVSSPLEVVQIDHTVMDVMVVDECDRSPIGRPYFTVAIDVFSRCIVGMLVTLEAPSATSVALCLTHVVSSKVAYLERLGLSLSWPMYGKPQKLHLDNAAEFKSEALRRGCAQHGIEIVYRPPGQPNYGGIVERVIGTVMQMTHELPGTTFSNPAQKGAYDSQAQAALTLKELECWLVNAICGVYHASIQSGVHAPPAAVWAQAIEEENKPATVAKPTEFLIDFLPVIRRRIGRHGFVIDHITYFSNALQPWIAQRDQLDRFVIRRDPRDLSRIWVLDPVNRNYQEIPYRTQSAPPIALWEHRRAITVLREKGYAQVNEELIFQTIERMRTIVATAMKEKRRAKRDNARIGHLNRSTHHHKSPPPPDMTAAKEVPPFAEIEEW
ncbi:Mu transposase C-terminal domain-containing protein [Dyella caseinilytica]|nr:DDE-type integrase/transposase/recombinase [Dyella caseinilytica]